MNLTPRELATVLAALRHFQRSMAEGKVEPGDFDHFDTDLEVMTGAGIDALCQRLNFGDPAADPDPVAYPCSDLHAPELEALIPAVIAAYESIRADAHAAAAGTEPVDIIYDRIGNAEDPTPFGYCPPSAVPFLHRHGTIVATCLP